MWSCCGWAGSGDTAPHWPAGQARSKPDVTHTERHKRWKTIVDEDDRKSLSRKGLRDFGKASGAVRAQQEVRGSHPFGRAYSGLPLLVGFADFAGLYAIFLRG